ncbi:miraculin-like [Dorcoceras hygrometricum]|uniref:Miraculin-like n=1 Tax=Dorcoceras hygrometricum TaxID=472368 RepID=A0A2Z7A5R3_9LAMI|nr:miraculin-like [Dorcoceras hygrometricum]
MDTNTPAWLLSTSDVVGEPGSATDLNWFKLGKEQYWSRLQDQSCTPQCCSNVWRLKMDTNTPAWLLSTSDVVGEPGSATDLNWFKLGKEQYWSRLQDQSCTPQCRVSLSVGLVYVRQTTGGRKLSVV